METLYGLVDLMASWKFNQLQLYTEHTFAYAGHEVVWKDASPITPEKPACWTRTAGTGTSSLCRTRTPSDIWALAVAPAIRAARRSARTQRPEPGRPRIDRSSAIFMASSCRISAAPT